MNGFNSSSTLKHVVIVGAGQAGYQACASLREFIPESKISLVGDEPYVPYERPPLSKGYLLGEVDKASLRIRDENFYTDNQVELQEAVCTEIDSSKKQIRFSDGSELSYDELILATGSSPLKLPESVGGQLQGVYSLRNIADADILLEQLQSVRSVLIVGGGYIGLEIAAVVSKLGLKAVVIEASERILSRVAAPQTSDYFRKLHTENGVDIREGVKLIQLEGEDGKLTAGCLSDGTKIQADIAIIGIGIRPNSGLAEVVGLEVDNGIRVNDKCQTSDPNIFAIGDCASFPMDGSFVRLESVGNAIDMAIVAAQTIAGIESRYEAKPWFWSDQYDTHLQIAGLSSGYDNVVTRSSDDDSVSFWYYKGERLLAVDVINDSRSYLIAKKLIEQGKSPEKKKIQSNDTNLKSLLKG